MLRLSQSGIDLLKRLEGCSTVMYKDVAGYPTIGVGHLLTKSELSSGKLLINGEPVKWGNGLAAQQCDDLLAQDVHWAENATGAVLVPLTLNQFDALVSFIFNVGEQAFRGSTLLRKLNAHHYDEVPAQMRRWTMAGGKAILGLKNRREWEVKKWLGEA